MATYLLTWNASRDELDWAYDLEEKYHDRGSIRLQWACGNTKRIQQGDRLFFLRQRMEPRGLLAIGHVETAPFYDDHWNNERANAGDQALYVNAMWDYFSVEPIIPRTRLDDPRYSQVHWNTQRSGISVPDEIADLLEDEFRAAVTGNIPQELPGRVELPEGARRRITVNAYERNPRARRRCIAHYGTVCSVCELDLSNRYGEVAEGRIHVHHLTPLSEIGEDYSVDPLRDLRPVCPNCHMVIHLSSPPFTIEEVKRMIERT